MAFARQSVTLLATSATGSEALRQQDVLEAEWLDETARAQAAGGPIQARAIGGRGRRPRGVPTPTVRPQRLAFALANRMRSPAVSFRPEAQFISTWGDMGDSLSVQTPEMGLL